MPQEIQGPFSDSFGGVDLSLASGSVDPSMGLVSHNCEVSSDGAIVRRGGTSLVGLSTYANPFDPAINSYVNATTIRTAQGNTYIVYVFGDTGLAIQRVLQDGDAGQRRLSNVSITKLGVFGRRPTNVTFVGLSMPYDRLLIFSSNNPPVQVSLVERSTSFEVTAVAGANKTVSCQRSPNDAPLWGHTGAASSAFVFSRTTDFTVNSTSVASTLYNTSVVDPLNELGAVLSKAQLTLTKVTWQWVSEAEQYIGGNFTQRITRFNVTKADQNVKLPPELTTDYDAVPSTAVYTGITVGTVEGGASAGYTLVAKPSTNLEYQLTAGGRYDFNAAVTPPITPVFVTFGDIQTVNTTTPLVVQRQRLLRINKGRSLPFSNVLVYVDKTLCTQHTAESLSVPYNAVLGLQVDITPTIRTDTIAFNTASLINSVRFTASVRALPFDSEILICNASTDWCGTSARKVAVFDVTLTDYDGAFVPFAGFGEYSDYLSGVFPTVATLHRDRLVVAGVGSRNESIGFSAVSDQLSPGRHFSYYQIDEGLGDTPVDPFSVNLPIDSSESITAAISWQNSLILFSNLRTYAISGGEVLGPGSFDVSVISSYGAFNQRCVAVSDLTLLFLNAYGLFELGTKQSSRDYGATERSLRVASLFNSYPNLAASAQQHWLFVDYVGLRAYMGLCTESTQLHTDVHLALKLSSDSWSTLSSAVEFKLFGMFSADGDVWSFARLFGTSNYCILGFNRKHHLDYLRTETAAVTFMPPLTPTLRLAPNSRLSTKYPLLPGVNDIDIVNATKVFTNYYKGAGAYTVNFARMPLTPIGSGQRIPVVVVPPTGTASLTPLVGYTQSNVTTSMFTLNDSLGTATRGVGVSYVSQWSSGVFDLEAMGRLHRLRRLHLKFDTSVASDVSYPQNPNVAVEHRANVVVSNNYNETSDPVLLSTYPLPAANLQRGVIPMSIPLQGMGCDYQFHVYSVADSPFKLTQYEFDVKPQRGKRFTRS